MKSLSEFGQRKPIVVWKGVVIAGCGTLESVTRLGWAEIAITRNDDLSPERAEAFAIADNKTSDMSEFNYELLAEVITDLKGKNIDLSSTGFQDFELAPLLSADWKPLPENEDKESQATALKITAAQLECMRPAIEWAKESLKDEYDVSTDADALAAFCYHSMK